MNLLDWPLCLQTLFIERNKFSLFSQSFAMPKSFFEDILDQEVNLLYSVTWQKPACVMRFVWEKNRYACHFSTISPNLNLHFLTVRTSQKMEIFYLFQSLVYLHSWCYSLTMQIKVPVKKNRINFLYGSLFFMFHQLSKKLPFQGQQ